MLSFAIPFGVVWLCAQFVSSLAARDAALLLKTANGWLDRTVLGIGLASLFSDVGHEMATTAMPVLLSSLGASSAILGLIEGLADGLSSFAKLFSDLYSDRLRKRIPLAVAGYFGTASGMASFALATQWWHVLLGRGRPGCVDQHHTALRHNSRREHIGAQQTHFVSNKVSDLDR